MDIGPRLQGFERRLAQSESSQTFPALGPVLCWSGRQNPVKLFLHWGPFSAGAAVRIQSNFSCIGARSLLERPSESSQTCPALGPVLRWSVRQNPVKLFLHWGPFYAGAAVRIQSNFSCIGARSPLERPSESSQTFPALGPVLCWSGRQNPVKLFLHWGPFSAGASVRIQSNLSCIGARSPLERPHHSA